MPDHIDLDQRFEESGVSIYPFAIRALAWMDNGTKEFQAPRKQVNLKPPQKISCAWNAY